jgi:hypothetical protein
VEYCQGWSRSQSWIRSRRWSQSFRNAGAGAAKKSTSSPTVIETEPFLLSFTINSSSAKKYWKHQICKIPNKTYNARKHKKIYKKYYFSKVLLRSGSGSRSGVNVI